MHRAAGEAEVELRLEAVHLAAERVALGDDVDEPEVARSSMIEPGAGAEHRPAGGVEGAQRLGQPLALDAERHRRRLAAGQDQRVEPVEVGRARGPRAPPRRARAASGRAPRSRPAARGRRRAAARRRPASPAAAREQLLLVELARLEALHRVAEAARGAEHARRVVEVRRRLDDRRARGAPGSSLLKMPEPTNTPSAPSCIISDASAGVAMPPAQKSDDRQPAVARRPSARGRAARRAPWPRSPARRRRACRGGGSRR